MSEIKKETFPILGMSCASCAARVDKALNGQPGVQEACVNYASATAQVVYDADECSPLVLKGAVQNAGYDLLIEADEEVADEVEKVRMASMDVNVGDHVSVKSGPLEGFSGLVESVDEKRRKVIVRVAMFGKETPAEVDYSQVVKTI